MDILYVTYFLNGFLMIAMPLALAIYLTRRWKLSWRFWFVGAAVFILSQVGHIPFLYWLTGLFKSNILPNPPAAWKDVFNALVLGLLAGLFEELARYAMFRWWLKDARSWRKGVLAGAGHGGAEAISLGVIVLLAYVNYIILRNPANLANVPAAQLGAVTSQVAAYWSAPWYVTLVGALERFLTIPVQICLSVVVLQTFTRKQWVWVWLAVFFHAVVDATTVLAAPAVGIYWTEAIVAGFSVLSVWLIFRLRQPEPVEPEVEVFHQAVIEITYKTKTKISAEIVDQIDSLIATLLQKSNQWTDEAQQRIKAAEDLGKIGDARAVEPLIATAIGEYDYDVQVAAIQALTKIGDSRARKPLVELYQRKGLWKDANPRDLTNESIDQRMQIVGKAAAIAIKKLDSNWSEPIEMPHFVILFRDGTDQPSNPEKYYKDIAKRAYGSQKVEFQGWRIAGVPNSVSVDEARSIYNRATAWAGGLPNWGIPINTWMGKGLDGRNVVALFFA